MGTKLLIFAGLLILFATGTGLTLTYLFGRKEEKRKSLSDTLKMYDTTPKKSFFLKREFVSAKETLVDTDQAGEIPRLIVKCVIGVTIGIFAAFVLFGSILLAVIFGLTGFMVPLWRLKFYKNKHKKYLARQLESATFLISTTYIRGGNIEEAIRENIEQIAPIIIQPFKEFLVESKVNPSTKTCVRHLKEKINDDIFKEWCDTLMRTLDNSEMRESLLPIVNKYAELRMVQDEVDGETKSSILEYIIMMAMDVLCYVVVYVINKEWFSYYYTFAGHLVVAYTAGVLLYSLIKLISVFTPVEYRK